MPPEPIRMPVTYEKLSLADMESDGGLSEMGDIILTTVSSTLLIAGCCVGIRFFSKSTLFADYEWAKGALTIFLSVSGAGLPTYVGVMDCVEKGELLGNKSWSNTKN